MLCAVAPDSQQGQQAQSQNFRYPKKAQNSPKYQILGCLTQVSKRNYHDWEGIHWGR